MFGSSVNRSRQLVGTVLISLGGLMLVSSGAAKLARIPKVAVEMTAMGYGGSILTMIGILEIGCAFLFLVPVTRSFGLLMVSAFMGGAIATHVGHGKPFIQPAMVLAMLWLGTWLGHPEILWSFLRRAPVSSQFSAPRRPVGALEQG